MKTFWMLIRREFWEHRTLWLTPFVVAGLVLLAVVFQDQWQGAFRGGPGGLTGRGNDGPIPGTRAAAATLNFFNLEALFFIAAALVVVAYLLDCLYTERRDRSILFWKSLPISDRSVVLAKFTVAALCVPVLYFVVAAATNLLASAILSLRGTDAQNIVGLYGGDALEWLRLQAVVLYSVVATVLWYAPYAAYLMLISAWARRSTFAWAVAPPVLAALIERVVFDTNNIGRLVQRGFNELYRLAFRINQQIEFTLGDVLQPIRRGGRQGGGPGGPGGPGGGRGPGGDQAFDARFDPTDLLASPQLWLGLVAAVLMIWAAIALRRRSRDA